MQNQPLSQLALDSVIAQSKVWSRWIAEQFTESFNFWLIVGLSPILGFSERLIQKVKW